MVSTLRGLPVTNVTQRYRLCEHANEHAPMAPQAGDCKQHVVQCVSFTPINDPQSTGVYTSPIEQVKACIQEEADVYGYIPRNLFLTLHGRDMLKYRTVSAVRQVSSSRNMGSKTLIETSDDTRQVLIQEDPSPPSTEESGLEVYRYNYYTSDVSIRWMGRYALNTVVANYLYDYTSVVEIKPFSSQIRRLFGGDKVHTQLRRILWLGLLAIRPMDFRAHYTSMSAKKEVTVGRNSRPAALTTLPSLDLTRITPIPVPNTYPEVIIGHRDDSTSRVRCVSDKELVDFVSAVDCEGMVYTLNSSCYTGIDGVIRFHLPDPDSELSDPDSELPDPDSELPDPDSELPDPDAHHAKGEWITAICQVIINPPSGDYTTNAATIQLTDEVVGSIELLYNTAVSSAKAKKLVNHRVVLLTLVEHPLATTTGAAKYPRPLGLGHSNNTDNDNKSDIGIDIEHYIVGPTMNSLSASDQWYYTALLRAGLYK